jgi:hypothetical protein
MTERRFHTDSRVGENFTKDGLETLTGQPSRKWGRYVVKELLDNALEAVEEADTEMPTVTVDADVVEHGANTFIREITIADNGDGIPESQINQIADVERFGGTKRHYALPTRGTQGNALMTVLGIQHLADGELVIETHGQCHVFSVNADTLSGAPTVDVNTVDSESVGAVTAPSAASDGGVSADGTAVTVNFGDKGEHLARFDPIARMLLGFVALNPHVQFRIPLGVNNRAADTTTRYQPKGSATTGRVHWMSQQAFQERIKADIRAAPDLTVGEFITEFEGLVSRKKQRAVISTEILQKLSVDADAALSDVCTTKNGERLHQNTVDFLHASMCEHTDKRATSGLAGTVGSVGESMRAGPRAYLEHYTITDVEQLVADLQADGNDVDSWEDLSIYYQTTGADERDTYRIPFVYEIGVLPLPPDSSDRVVENFGINQSVSYSSPQVNLEFSGTGNTEYTARSIQDAFDRQEHGFIVVSNITCPNIPFKDKGKQDFPTEPFEQEISETVGKAVRKYQRDLRPMLNALEEDDREPQQPTLDESKKAPRGFIKDAVFDLFDQVYAQATDGGKYTIMLRQLYYKMRPAFQNRIEIEGYEYTSTSTYENRRELELNYDTYTDYVAEYETDVLGERVVHRDQRGFFIEPHSNERIQLSTQKVSDYEPAEAVATEYDTLLFVEKKGYYEQLHKDFEITKQYDIGLINAQGYSTNAIRTLVEKVQAANDDVTLLTLTDLDINGLGIATDAAEADELSSTADVFDTERIGVTLEDVREYGLATESTSLNKQDKTKLQNRYENGEIDEDVFEFLRDGKRVEINAFSPSQLKNYIESKLQALDVDKIVPDESDVETPDVDDWDDVRERAVESGIGEFVAEQIDDDLIDSIAALDDDIQLPDESDRASGDANAEEIRNKIEEQLKERPPRSWEDINDDVVDDHTEAVDDQQQTYEDTAKSAVKDVLEQHDIISIDADQQSD